jgi:hypothetical protein
MACIRQKVFAHFAFEAHALVMMRTTRTLMLIVPLWACTYSGTGDGVILAPSTTPTMLGQARGRATFAWSARGDATEGKIRATLPGGRTFHGTFLQMTSSSRYDSYAPYWGLWTSPRWGYWGPGYYGPSSQFATHYHGKALAYLEGPNNEVMRCCFMLKKPNEGVAGGAKGDCQLSSQEQIFDVTLDRKK